MRLLPPTEKNKTRKLLLKSPSQTATSWTGRRRFFFLKNKIKRTVTGFDFISCCLGIKGLWTFFLIFIFFSLTYTERYTSKFHSRSESERRVYSIRSLFLRCKRRHLSTMKIAMILIGAAWMVCATVEAGKGKARKSA